METVVFRINWAGLIALVAQESFTWLCLVKFEISCRTSALHLNPTVFHAVICDRLRENRAQRGVCNIEKRSIDFFKMYCFKPTEGNG